MMMLLLLMMMMMVVVVVVVMLVNAKLPYCTHVLHQSVHVAVSHGRTGSDVGIVAGQPLAISRHVLGEQQLAGRRVLHTDTHTQLDLHCEKLTKFHDASITMNYW